MRSLWWKVDRPWRAAREWRVLCDEDIIRHRVSQPKKGLMLLGERVDDATTK